MSPLAKAYQELNEFNRLLSPLSTGKLAKISNANIAAYACFNTAIEHQNAIRALYRHRTYGSALALLRILYESVMRGLWFHFCAKEEEVELFKATGKIMRERGQKKSIEVKIGDMVEEVDKKQSIFRNRLAKIKKRDWSSLCDFTHTGAMQLACRFTETQLIPSYKDEDLLTLLEYTHNLTIIAFTFTFHLEENKFGEEKAKFHLEHAR